MRWNSKNKYESRKVITRKWFAWLPITIDHEVRWLEYVTVEGYWFTGIVSGSWLFIAQRFIDCAE